MASAETDAADAPVGASGGSDSLTGNRRSDGGTSEGVNGQPEMVGQARNSVLSKISELKGRLADIDEVPEFLYDAPLECLSPQTEQNLTYFLDPESDVMSDRDFCKDYRGVSQWLGLDIAFQRYIEKIDTRNKLKEVLSMWVKEGGVGEVPPADIGHLRKCLIDIDRPDALSTLATQIGNKIFLFVSLLLAGTCI